jgi:hypothetical protein
MSIIKSLTPCSPNAVPLTPVASQARYLADGARLLRRTVALGRCLAGFVWLEDLRSLTGARATAGDATQLTPAHAPDEDPEPQ